MKKFFAFFKRAFTGPITCMADANQRASDLKKLLIIMGIAFGACTVLGMIPKLDIFAMLSPIPGLIALVVIFLMFMVKRIKARFEFLTCDTCKADAAIKTEDDCLKFVGFTIKEANPIVKKPVVIQGKESFMYNEIKVEGLINVVVDISWTCQSCSAVKTKQVQFSPFACEASERNIKIVTAQDMAAVQKSLADKVALVLEHKLSETDEYDIPLTVTSIYHPNYENRAKPGCDGARAEYLGVTITRHRYVDEMIDGYFIRNEINF